MNAKPTVGDSMDHGLKHGFGLSAYATGSLPKLYGNLAYPHFSLPESSMTNWPSWTNSMPIIHAPDNTSRIVWRLSAFDIVTGEPVEQMTNPPTIYFQYGDGPYVSGQPVPMLMIIDGQVSDSDQQLLMQTFMNWREPEVSHEWLHILMLTLIAAIFMALLLAKGRIHK